MTAIMLEARYLRKEEYNGAQSEISCCGDKEKKRCERRPRER